MSVLSVLNIHMCARTHVCVYMCMYVHTYMYVCICSTQTMDTVCVSVNEGGA